MFEQLMVSFQTYYGLDWLSFVLGLTGTWLLTQKSRWGFLLTASSMGCAAGTAIIAGQYGFIAANIVQIVLLLHGFRRWGRSPDTLPVEAIAEEIVVEARGESPARGG